MDAEELLLQAGVRYYFPQGKVPPYNFEQIKQELVELVGATAEEYAFHLFVTFTPPIVRRLYPDTAQRHHVNATIPLLAKILNASK